MHTLARCLLVLLNVCIVSTSFGGGVLQETLGARYAQAVSVLRDYPLLKHAKIVGVGLTAAVVAGGAAAYGVQKKRHELKERKERVSKAQSDPELAAAEFGNKYANLLRLKMIGKQLSAKDLAGYAFNVPAFTGLSSDDVKWFLKHFLKISLDEQWRLHVQGKDSALVRAGAAIAKEVEIAFQAKKDLLKGKCFSDLFPFCGAHLDDFLKQKAERNAKLMVRSSGREDSATLANAGGNLSVVNVACEVPVILESIVKVVLSYMSETSLQQRSMARDAITAVPFVPFLIPEMVM